MYREKSLRVKQKITVVIKEVQKKKRKKTLFMMKVTLMKKDKANP